MTDPAALLADARAEHHSVAAEDPEPGETTFWCDTCDAEAPCLTELLARAVEAALDLDTFGTIRAAITEALEGTDR